MPDSSCYGTPTCPFTRELREQLEWTGRDSSSTTSRADAEAPGAAAAR